MKLEEGILGQETRKGGYGRTRRQESGGEEVMVGQEDRKLEERSLGYRIQETGGGGNSRTGRQKTREVEGGVEMEDRKLEKRSVR